MSSALRVALLQLRAHDLDAHEAAWASMLLAIDEAASDHPDLIVLPEASYPAYFLYSREAYDAAGVRRDEVVLDALAERARRHSCYLAAGLVLHSEADPDGPLEDACVVFNRSGRIIARVSKSLLWHFDARWFRAGHELGVFDLDGATAGAIICADGRLPEVTRGLAVAGARLVIDTTAWVSTGRDAARLRSPMVDYLMRARAIENGVWVIAADKVGVEAGTLVYAGGSGVIDPRGRWVARAPSDRPGIVAYTLDLDEARGAPVTRRPELYSGAAVPPERAVATILAREPLTIEDAAARVAVAALDLASPEPHPVERCRSLLRALEAQECALLVLPDLADVDGHGEPSMLPAFLELSAESPVMIAVGLLERADDATFRTQYLLDHGSVVAAHRQTHLDEAALERGVSTGDLEPPVLDTTVGYLGLLGGAEGLVPELARSLKLRGAEVLAWSAGSLDVPQEVLARSRAAENRAYVAAAGLLPGGVGGAWLVDPTGTILATTLEGAEMAASADVNRALARWNDMAPHTNPVRDRDPAAYALLFR